jgi:hypothetical protein
VGDDAKIKQAQDAALAIAAAKSKKDQDAAAAAQKPQPAAPESANPAPKTNTAALPARGSAAPLTKEQRLNDLLGRYKNDEITPLEYQTERAKIMAEP